MNASADVCSRRSPWERMLLFAVAATMGVATVAVAANAAAPPGPSDPPAGGAALHKSSISPRLAAEVASDRGRPTEGWWPATRHSRTVVRDAAGRLAVDVAGAPVPLAAISDLGAVVVAAAEEGRRATVLIAADDVDALAALPGVRYVAGVQPPVRSDLRPASAPPIVTNATCADRIVSEGDAQLRADVARTTHGVDGSGVRVGIVSDSFDDLGGAIADVAAGELPGATNPCGRATPVVVQSDLGDEGSDEGRAMAQIVHDLAPGAELAVATASFGELDMAQQIRDLATAGADITTDDIFWLTEPLYEEGPIAEAIADNRAERGVVHFSSAGNSHLVVGGKPVGGYETDGFRAAPCPPAVTAFDASFVCHDYDVGGPVDAGSGITVAGGGSITLLLGWAEPRNAVATDLDLFLIDQLTGEIVAGSAEDSPAKGMANEFLRFENTSGGARGFDIVVGRFGAAPSGQVPPRFRHALVRTSGVLAVERSTTVGPDRFGPTLVGHGGSDATMSVAAVPFDDAATVEPFSSRGPALTCIDESVVSACASTTVDLAATDGTANSFFGTLDDSTWRFFGTSAAAPHAAAVAALVHERSPCAGADEIEAALTTTAVAVGASDVDAVGAGLIDAAAAVGAIAAGGACPTIESSTPVRFADSRDEPTFDGQFRRTGPRNADSTWEIDIAGRGAVPEDAVGAVANVTIVNGAAPGFATVYPCGTRPLASSLNYAPGTIDANELVAKLSPQGTICIYTLSAADVIVDVVGHLPAPTNYTPLTPLRFADSRDEPTFDGNLRNTGPRAAGTTWEIPITGRGGVPENATTVVANVTATNGRAEGFATVHPCGSLPQTSSLNYAPGLTRPNEVVARLSPQGTLCVFTFATVDLVVDVVGYVLDEPDLVTTSPQRFADSRDEPTFDGNLRNTGRRAAGSTWEIPIAGRGGVPDDATTVIANVTVTNGQAEGFATVYPCGTLPTASSLNYAPGVTRPNELVARLSPRGTLCIHTFAEVDVIVDIAGHD